MEEIIKFENVDKEYKLGNKKQKVKIIDFIFNSKKLNKKKALTNVNFSTSFIASLIFVHSTFIGFTLNPNFSKYTNDS